MKKILFLLDNTFVNDRRVSREAFTLTRAGYELVLLAVKGNSLPEKEFVDGFWVERIFEKDIFDVKKSRCFNKYAMFISKHYSYDIVHAHDQTMLHLGVKLKRINSQIKLIYDSHELFHAWPLNVSNYNSIIVWLKSYVVRKILIHREYNNRKYIDFNITVNNSLAKNLNDYLDSKTYPFVIRNLPDKAVFKRERKIIHEKLDIPLNKKVLVFIGANIYRHTLNIEQVMHEVQSVEDFVLVFICSINSNSKPVIDYVKQNGLINIYFHDKISPKEIPEYLSSADIGLVPTWNKKDLSYWFALDNKLFEYIQSEIPVLATQQPEYVNIVDKYKCGVCVNPDEKDAYIRGFYNIMSKYDDFVANTKLAKEELCWENEEQVLIDLYKNIDNE